MVVAFFLLGCPACAGVVKPPGSDLKQTVETFHHDLRWKYYDAAIRSVDSRWASDFQDALDDLNEVLNITSWEIRRVTLSSDGTEAKIRVAFKYFLIPSTVVHDKTVSQVWKLQAGRWYLASQSEGPFVFPPAGALEQSIKEPDHQRSDKGDLPDATR